MPQRARRARRSRLPWILTAVGIVALVVAWAIWYVRTPDALPTSTRTVSDSGAVGQEVYVGMFAVGDDFDRTVHISKVDVDVSPGDGVEVEPLICRNGSISITTDAAASCEDLVTAEDADFSDDDSIILSVTASKPGTVEIGRLEVSFSDGLKRGTDPAGIAGATLVFAQGDPGVAPSDTSTDDGPSERPSGDSNGDHGGKKKHKKKGDAAGA